jgi:ribonuclease-3
MAHIKTLLDKLDYQFDNTELLNEALSHRSIGSCNYERLEFLGDSLLNFIIANELFHHRRSEDEGSLSRLRASLVRQSTLAQIARELQLGDHLKLGVGELRSGGFNRDSILSDVVESLIGAVFIEAGYDRARALVLHLYGSRIAELPASSELKDPKTRLQEQLQSQSRGLPQYDVIETSGKAHNMQFTVKCKLQEPELQVTATASSRRKAEQAAAQQLLEKMQSND